MPIPTDGPTLLSKTIRTGQHIEIFEITLHGRERSCRARVDGVLLNGHGRPCPVRAMEPNGVYVLGTTPRVLLTCAEAALIRDHWTAAALAAPAGQMAALREQRQRLIRHANGLAADAEAEYWELAEHVSRDEQAHQVRASRQSAIDAAFAALADFDAAHPEVRAALEREAAERARESRD